MKKLNFLGIGPKIATILLPWLTLAIIISSITKGMFNYAPLSKTIFYSGAILMTFALVFYVSTVRLLLKGLKETTLITTGPYSMSQNPLYASIILFIIPALSLLLNSWLVLTSSVVGYVLFKIFIKQEYTEMEKFFGEKYIDYKKNTSEFFPFPKR